MSTVYIALKFCVCKVTSSARFHPLRTAKYSYSLLESLKPVTFPIMYSVKVIIPRACLVTVFVKWKLAGDYRIV